MHLSAELGNFPWAHVDSEVMEQEVRAQGMVRERGGNPRPLPTWAGLLCGAVGR